MNTNRGKKKGISRKGQIIGQALTSFPAIIIIIIIVTVFLVVVSFSSLTKSADSERLKLNLRDVDSRIILNMFLGDFVIFNGEKISINSMLEQLAIEGGQRKKSNLEITKLIEDRFSEKYSCDEKEELIVNQLVSDIVYDDGAKDRLSYISHIDYPNKRVGVDRFAGPTFGYSDFPEDARYVGVQIGEGYNGEYYTKQIDVESYSLRVSVKGDISCLN